MPAPDWLTWQLADSAFPTGGFAHSWGLEAAWQGGEIADPDPLRRFAREVVWQAGRAAMPFLTAAHRHPHRLDELDQTVDVFLTNVVANRASRVQGRALLATAVRIWPSERLQALEAGASRRCGHCAPMTGAVMQALDVPVDVVQRLFLYTTVRGVLAAAVRLGIAGSYQAQRLQSDCGALLGDVLARCGALADDEAAQTAPVLDLMHAAHDRLYSRLFQS